MQVILLTPTFYCIFEEISKKFQREPFSRIDFIGQLDFILLKRVTRYLRHHHHQNPYHLLSHRSGSIIDDIHQPSRWHSLCMQNSALLSHNELRLPQVEPSRSPGRDHLYIDLQPDLPSTTLSVAMYYVLEE